jgi:hypothetical protein
MLLGWTPAGITINDEVHHELQQDSTQWASMAPAIPCSLEVVHATLMRPAPLLCTRLQHQS